jgi:hypothetical protein
MHEGNHESTWRKEMQAQIFTGDEHGQNAEILEGILRHIEIQRFEKYSAASAAKDAEARRTHGSQRHGGETDPVCDQNRVRTEY